MSFTATVTMNDPCGRVVSWGLVPSVGFAVACGARCTAVTRTLRRVSWVVGSPGFVLSAPSLKLNPIPTWSPASIRPPTTRFGSSSKVTSCIPVGTLTAPLVLASAGFTRRSARSCSPGTRSTAATFPVESSRELSAVFATAVPGICCNATEALTTSSEDPAGTALVTTSTPVGLMSATARWSAPWA